MDIKIIKLIKSALESMLIRQGYKKREKEKLHKTTDICNLYF